MNAYGADMGMVYIYGVLVTIPSVICAGLILPKFLGNLERPTPSFLKADQPVDMNNLPSFRRFDSGAADPAIIMISTTIANIWLVKDTPARKWLTLSVPRRLQCLLRWWLHSYSLAPHVVSDMSG